MPTKRPARKTELTPPPPFKVFITPFFRGEDEGDGGVRRAIDMQRATFPKAGAIIVETPEEADIILVHIMEKPDWLARYPDKPLVVDNHGLYWAEYEWANWSLKANKECMETIRQADGAVAHSEWVAQALRRHTMRDVEVIPHGIDLRDWSGDPHENRGYVLWNKTRIDPVCDPTPVQYLAELLPDVQFLSTYALRATPNINIVGTVSFEDSKLLVQEAGVYLCTTRETFGVGTLEAMAAGVPVVGWAWGGQREFLTHGRDAWLSPPHDYEQLARGVRWALANRDEIAAAASETLQQFRSAVVARTYTRYLRRTLRQWRRSRKAPRTSVIVTAYNIEQYLPTALNSVLDQTDPDWECIIVNDSSTDKSGEIAEEYVAKDERFRAVHTLENLYISGAKNAGIAEAGGRYVLPLDADDQLAPGAVGALAEALDQMRGIHVAYGNVFFTEEDGTPSQYGSHEPGRSGWPMPFVYEWQEGQRNLIPYSSMFRRSAWEATGGYRRRCRTAEDADMWLRFASYGFRPFMVTEEDTLIYRNREGSVSRAAGGRDWAVWFPWSEEPAVRPAGALTENQAPIPSLDPPEVSVIIPIGLGHEALVWDAIDSVDAQTYRQWECIVINDTGAPLPHKLPSWVRLIETSGTVGVAAARNAGIREARGRFFVPLDADDYLQPRYLELMLEAHRQVGEPIIYSDWFDEGEDRNVTIYQAPDYDAKLLTSKGCIHAVTALYERSLWEELGGFDEQLPAWEDWDFQLGAAQRGKCSTRVPLALWVYRKYTGYRRESNHAQFEESKQGILTKWGDYFQGRSELMACSGCRGKTASVPQMAQANGGPPQQGAVEMEYVGESAGTKGYRGPSGTVYYFDGGQNRRKYVLEGDAEHFLTFPDFRRAESALTQTAQSPTPALVAEGPPQR